MQAAIPSSPTTLVILLGASEWPYSPAFTSSQAFAITKQKLKAYFLDQHLFGLPSENLLDLFDTTENPDSIDQAIGAFLDRRIAEMRSTGTPASDLLFYFVGHGGFLGNDFDFYLAIRHTREDSPRPSSIQINALADLLKEKARHLRRFLILDCCFAAAAFRAFQSAPSQVAIVKTVDAFTVLQKSVGFPRQGTVLLCSADHKTPSILSPDENSTMFSQAFLDVLLCGRPYQQTYLTLREIRDLVADRLQEIPSDAPKPVLLSPDQSEGDLADVPFFPNTAVEMKKYTLNHNDFQQASIPTAISSPITHSQYDVQRRKKKSFIIILTIVALAIIGLAPSILHISFNPQQDTSRSNATNENIVLSYSALQSRFWVFSGQSQQYSLSHLPSQEIGALYTNGHISDPLYSLFFELHFGGKQHAGAVIDKVEVLIQQVHKIPHPVTVWDPEMSSVSTNNAAHVYEALYSGQEVLSAITLNHNYVPTHSDIFLLPSGDTDTMELHMISRVEGDILFTVEISYHFYGETLFSHMLTMPGHFEVMFVNSSNWLKYYFQDGKLTTES